MESIDVMVAPAPCSTRMLAASQGRDLLKAVLPPLEGAHPRAVATVLEGLAIWTQQRLSVVLVVDEEEPSSCGSLVLCDALGFGERSLHYDVAIAARRSPRRRRHRIDGVADFRDLDPLRLEVLR